ncbi:uncharacterized protein MELLADRAFT_84169 [Melampsora larici-populina 98AG31]|uniref:Uncharacterized protein n=1 Tax=Melampsora larici-populina (strain 98AG31 / pathotype 3-4-7) TaxID=747676 RepID=F4SBS0_MELLP|nr:uncharacterized protein MELLADRAFT_84169 [Melampsora larici-populina 98AG31]EGF97914.1 hypothetical protein MELLADRAFT_84169 [Melampsora larici-populina 98AG31]
MAASFESTSSYHDALSRGNSSDYSPDIEDIKELHGQHPPGLSALDDLYDPGQDDYVPGEGYVYNEDLYDSQESDGICPYGNGEGDDQPGLVSEFHGSDTDTVVPIDVHESKQQENSRPPDTDCDVNEHLKARGFYSTRRLPDEDRYEEPGTPTELRHLGYQAEDEFDTQTMPVNQQQKSKQMHIQSSMFDQAGFSGDWRKKRVTHNESGLSAAHVELGKRPREDVDLDFPDQSHTFQKKFRETKGDLEDFDRGSGPRTGRVQRDQGSDQSHYEKRQGHKLSPITDVQWDYFTVESDVTDQEDETSLPVSDQRGTNKLDLADSHVPRPTKGKGRAENAGIKALIKVIIRRDKDTNHHLQVRYLTLLCVASMVIQAKVQCDYFTVESDVTDQEDETSLPVSDQRGTNKLDISDSHVPRPTKGKGRADNEVRYMFDQPGLPGDWRKKRINQNSSAAHNELGKRLRESECTDLVDDSLRKRLRDEKHDTRVPAHSSRGNNKDEFQRLDVSCSDQHKRTGDAENRERNSTRTPLHHKRSRDSSHCSGYEGSGTPTDVQPLEYQAKEVRHSDHAGQSAKEKRTNAYPSMCDQAGFSGDWRKKRVTHNESGLSAAHVELYKRPREDVYLDCPDQTHTFEKKFRETKGDLEDFDRGSGPRTGRVQRDQGSDQSHYEKRQGHKLSPITDVQWDYFTVESDVTDQEDETYLPVSDQRGTNKLDLADSHVPRPTKGKGRAENAALSTGLIVKCEFLNLSRL